MHIMYIDVYILIYDPRQTEALYYERDWWRYAGDGIGINICVRANEKLNYFKLLIVSFNSERILHCGLIAGLK